MDLIQVSLPTREAIAAWAAAASTAGAVLPGAVADRLLHHAWDHYGPTYGVDADEILDAFTIAETTLAAARAVWREYNCPLVRGLDIKIQPNGSCCLTWQTENHIVSVIFGEGWATADLPNRGDEQGEVPHCTPDLTRAIFSLSGPALVGSPRLAAAAAASRALVESGDYQDLLWSTCPAW